jgi:fluoride exporter
MQFLLVALGGAIGAVSRYALSLLITNTKLPWSTFVTNIIGSFIIGAFIAWQTKNYPTININNNLRLFVATGICGGFTTFSTFSVEMVQFLQQQKIQLALTYALSSLTLCIVATFLGYKLFNYA